MADYVYSVAIQVNSFQNNMADKTVWRINRGRINEYSLYMYCLHNVHVYTAHTPHVCGYIRSIIHSINH